MIIVEDTRNQVGKHNRLNADLEKLGVKVIRNKLFVGDYTRLENQSICIDTKKDWCEVAGNLCNSKEHERFKNECVRALENNIKLYVLVEENCKVSDWQPPKKRDGSPRTRVNPETLKKILLTMQNKYGVVFLKCDKKQTANIILSLLGAENEKDL